MIVSGTDSLAAVPDGELLCALGDLVAKDRQVEAELLAHLGEVDARRLYLAEGFPSMFAYCVEALHFSDSGAYHRIHAARAARRHPMVLDRVRRGEIHLAGVSLLAPHLTTESCEELLDLARHQSKRAIEEILANRAPKPDAATIVRRLPGPSTPTAPAEKPLLIAANSAKGRELPASAPPPDPAPASRAQRTAAVPLGQERFKSSAGTGGAADRGTSWSSTTRMPGPRPDATRSRGSSCAVERTTTTRRFRTLARTTWSAAAGADRELPPGEASGLLFSCLAMFRPVQPAFSAFCGEATGALHHPEYEETVREFYQPLGPNGVHTHAPLEEEAAYMEVGEGLPARSRLGRSHVRR